jgi:DNA-nicking Smr family endonuclease
MPSGRKPPDIGGKAGPDDTELWREVAAGVTPLKRRRKTVETPAPKPAASPTPAHAPRKMKKVAAPAPIAPPSPPAAPDPAPFDRRTVRRLKRGDVAIEARLDLHGDTQSAAHRRLERFIAESQSAGLRLVLIITGKGGRPDESGRGSERGVLRQAVPRWLEESPNRQRVLNVTLASAVHGGEGALYVRLRRKA